MSQQHDVFNFETGETTTVSTPKERSNFGSALGALFVFTLVIAVIVVAIWAIAGFVSAVVAPFIEVTFPEPIPASIIIVVIFLAGFCSYPVAAKIGRRGK